MRNLFDDFRKQPSLLRGAALHPNSGAGAGERDTLIRDNNGAPLLRLPFVQAIDWHRSKADIPVFDEAGAALGALHGFGELYRLWTGAVISEQPGPAAVIAEARQLGELLGPAPRPYALIHTVHSAHTKAPYGRDSEMDDLWRGWFDGIDDYDAVLWPTEQQREDAAARFGEHRGWFVVPHPAEPPAAFPDPARRDPNLAMAIARLSDVKQVDHIIHALGKIRENNPDARLEVLGDGPNLSALESLTAELGLQKSVRFRGFVPRAADELPRAGLLLLTSKYEGQSLAVLEALAAGTPAVSYDIRYGPREMIIPGVTGALVPPGGVAALAAAAADILGHKERIARMSEAAYAWALSHGVERSMQTTAEAVRCALSGKYSENKYSEPGGA
jgi:poly(glycerol-phosphate) alpha-glucosyltransferase